MPFSPTQSGKQRPPKQRRDGPSSTAASSSGEYPQQPERASLKQLASLRKLKVSQ